MNGCWGGPWLTRQDSARQDKVEPQKFRASRSNNSRRIIEFEAEVVLLILCIM